MKGKDVVERKSSKKNIVGILLLLVLSLVSVGIVFYNRYIHRQVGTTEELIAQDIENVGVPVAMAMDDNYLYPTIVAITSAMYNADAGTQYSFYIMHPPEFKEENKEKIRNLEKKYPTCHIHLIDMGGQFKKANDRGHITTPAYYRLALSELLVNLDKIIWLDGDTLVLQDLNQMYNIDMTGYYYKGYLDDNVYGAKSFGVETDHYICSGVMLVNLKELRDNKMVSKFNKFIAQNNDSLVQHDQTVINVVCFDKIGILPPKYGLINYSTTPELAKQYSDLLIAKNKYTHKDMLDALDDICVLHCVSKPWKSREAMKADLWWSYARKTDFYGEMKVAYANIFKN